jgi:predicted RNA-binding Zn-ribbon protein involved in translation (DUF1610 family)
MNSSERVSILASGQDWKELLINWSFPCPACGQIGILRTERESWYQCRHCGYAFGIERGLVKERERRTRLEVSV